MLSRTDLQSLQSNGVTLPIVWSNAILIILPILQRTYEKFGGFDILANIKLIDSMGLLISFKTSMLGQKIEDLGCIENTTWIRWY